MTTKMLSLKRASRTGADLGSGAKHCKVLLYQSAKVMIFYWAYKILQALPGFFTRGPCRIRENSQYINSLPF